MKEQESSPKLLWEPSEEFKKNSNLADYIIWLNRNHDLDFGNYRDLWKWSVSNIDDFWKSLWDYFKIISPTPYSEIVTGDQMPFIKWFTGSEVNYAEHIFRNISEEKTAIIFKSENSDLIKISGKEVKNKTASLRSYLIGAGVAKGDRVAAYLPNIPEANISFLATNSIGAIWSSCSPDFGTGAVIDRFSQIQPKVLITVDGYQYGGKPFNKINVLKKIISELPSLEKIILLPYLDKDVNSETFNNCILWEDCTKEEEAELKFEHVPFDHPIWILFSSGTTGIPKAITHSHGGILLEHLKYLAFHNNIKPGDRCFWYTTIGWMMWNYIQASWLCDGVVVLYDGSPAYPDINVLWKYAQDAKITHFGTSAGFIVANMKEGTNPGADNDLSSLLSIGSTGSPLPPEAFDWIYDEIKKDLWLASISGGTDVCSAFVGGNPLWPVYSGEIQCRALGCKLEAFNEEGESVIDKVGEMVITKPMPSMPIFFWNDHNNKQYIESYFEMYPGVWRHGDWTKVTSRDGIIIYGRSDSTLNRGGVRIGTSEVYRAVNKVKEVKDSLILCLEREDGDFFMPLFVVMRGNQELTGEIKNKIKKTIREEYTPRHVPDQIIEIKEVPYTISGKKVETPVKKILSGKKVEESINPDALKNPESLNFFKEYHQKLSHN